MIKFIFMFFILISCGKSDGLDGLPGQDGVDGQNSVAQQETLFLSTGSSCITSGAQLPTMLPDLCFSYVSSSLRIHPQVGSFCDTTTILYSQSITTTAIGTPVIVPEIGTGFSAADINKSNTFLFLSRHSGCGNIKAIEFRE